MATNITPLHDRVIIRRIEEGEQVRGGIIIPDTAKEKPQEGEVVAAGQANTAKTARARRSMSNRAIAYFSANTAALKSSSTAKSS